MKKRVSVYLVLMVLLVSVLAACGGGGGGGIAPNSVTLTANKQLALANGIEDVTLTAKVTDGGGNPLAGTTISFAITAGTGTLHSADLVTSASGTASVKVNRGPVDAPATNELVTVKATAAGSSGSATVKFINMPATATVQVGLTKAVSDIGILTFDLISTPTQTVSLLAFDPIGAAITAPFVGPGIGQTSFTWLAGGSTYAYMTSEIPGLAVAANSYFLGFTFGIDPGNTELPTFVIGPDHITASNSGGYLILPALTQADFIAAVVFDTE